MKEQEEKIGRLEQELKEDKARFLFQQDSERRKMEEVEGRNLRR